MFAFTDPVYVVPATPEAMEALVEKVARAVQEEVSFFNGWAISETGVKYACDKAASKALSAIFGATRKGRK